ncbi:hypothetical protein PENTCL1PPCAC_22355, partial [Pristionchus entomophagus]
VDSSRMTKDDGLLVWGCCFSTSSFYVYLSIIPVLGIIVMGISYKIYVFYFNIIMMESRLLDRKVKKLVSKVGKSSNSDHDKAPIPMPNDPLLNTDSTNKNHMGDRIQPIHLVQGSDGAALSSAAAAAPVSGPAAIPAAAAGGPGSGPASEEPLSPDDVTEMSGYNTQTASDYVNVSPQDTRPKLPDMPDLPSISTIDPGTDAEENTSVTSLTCAVSSQMTTPTTTRTNPIVSIPGKKDEDRDTLKILDDPIYGLKTEILSPDVSNTKSDWTNDPFQTYVVPRHMLR